MEVFAKHRITRSFQRLHVEDAVAQHNSIFGGNTDPTGTRWEALIGCLTESIDLLATNDLKSLDLAYPNRVGTRICNMGISQDIYSTGLFDDRYSAFLETLVELRPRLHRYCARMTGSVMDGEDVVQDALFEAYRKLDQYDQSRALTPWLFRIIHNRCIDFLRKRGVRDALEAEAAALEAISPVDPPGRGLDHAIERLVINLPPKERACVLLKDVFDYSLVEIAELVDSTTGGVKAALNRGRNKLDALQDSPKTESVMSPAVSELLRLYIERFNRHDWDGVRELASADARLRVADCFAGRLADSPYFIEYDRPIIPWRMALGKVDGDIAVIILRDDMDGMTPFSLIRLDVAGDRIVAIADYIKCPWVLEATDFISVSEP